EETRIPPHRPRTPQPPHSVDVTLSSGSQDCTLFFYTNAATTEINTLSLHDALPISWRTEKPLPKAAPSFVAPSKMSKSLAASPRSEEHTSELQSRENLVCRLLLEKKKVKPLAGPVLTDVKKSAAGLAVTGEVALVRD